LTEKRYSRIFLSPGYPLHLETPQSLSPFAGQVVTFTGKLSSLGRREAREVVERLGGIASEDVTTRTTMLVIGAGGVAQPKDDAVDDPDKSRKLRKAEQVNAKAPGQVAILTEDDFCRRAGVAAPGDLRQHFHAQRDILAMYPAIGEARLGHLEKWGVIRSVVRTNTETYYRFPDLSAIRQVAAELERGTPFRVIVRTALAAREGQLALDFRPAPSDAHPARVVTLERKPPPTTNLGQQRASAIDPHAALAAKYFLEGAALDEADAGPERQDQAAAAYRRALIIDPELVPAIVNLANIHYARDELIEAEALYERAIMLDGECFEAHFNLGNIHHDLSRYQEAVACYREAVTLNPGYADAHFYLAVTLEKMGQSSEAKPHWKAYQRLAPNGEWVELAKEFSE
jgi:tetratricopeptide (TPR) repeat protein